MKNSEINRIISAAADIYIFTGGLLMLLGIVTYLYHLYERMIAIVLI